MPPTHDDALDLTGVPCPKNAARTILRLMTMDDGEILKITIDDGEPVSLVPESIEDDGHVIVARNQLPDTRWELWIRVE
jgi:TusA-related sulfurtransferase